MMSLYISTCFHLCNRFYLFIGRGGVGTDNVARATILLGDRIASDNAGGYRQASNGILGWKSEAEQAGVVVNLFDFFQLHENEQTNNFFNF